MKKQRHKQQPASEKVAAQKSEEAMIAGILEGSPEGIAVAIVRLDCGCKKMAAVDKNGDPASKVIIYRDLADSICDKCKADNGAYMRVTEELIHWVEPVPDQETQRMIEAKVLGTRPTH